MDNSDPKALQELSRKSDLDTCLPCGACQVASGMWEATEYRCQQDNWRGMAKIPVIVRHG